ncbi:MAG: TonB-dependent receptor [Saprospiraceae bacterium]|nr:TonB-dependent receptor [Saprospiraceae bacterium]
MKKLFTFLAFFSIPFFAQAQVSVQGRIADEKAQPVPFVSVALISARDSHLIKGALTDDNGGFSIPSVSAGTYRILATAVGFEKTYTSTFDIKADSKTATVDVTLKVASKLLEEAVVVAQRQLFEQKPDRLVMNVANSPISAGGTVLEVLQKMPGLVVANEQIKLGGSRDVQVWIDGKPSGYTDVTAVLKDMPSDQIDRIELITQPGARYDAAGGPILNIILKRNAELGFTGTATMTVGGSRYDESAMNLGIKKFYRATPSVNMNYRSGQFNVFGSYSYGHRTYFNVQNVDRFIDNETYRQNNYSDNYADFQNYRAGLDFYATKKTTVGLLVKGWNRVGQDEASSVTDVFKREDLSQKLNAFVTENTTQSNRGNATVNFNAKHEFNAKTGHSLNFDLDYARFNTKNITDLTIYRVIASNLASKSQQNLNQPVDIYTGKLDYSLPIDSTFKADIGAKSSFSTVDNRLVFSRSGEVSARESNDFLYKENINAAYVNLNKKLGEIELSGGLRAEQTLATGTSKNAKVLDRNYLQWFPSASALFKFNQHMGVQASYSRRVDRPSFQQQNPFSYFIDSLTYQRGNPNLKPQILNTGQLAIVYDGQPFVSVEYVKTDDVIVENAPIREGTKTYTTAANLAGNENWTFQLNAPLNFAKWINGYVGNQAIYNAFDADYLGARYKASRWHWLAYTGATIKLPQDIKLEINGWYMTKFLEEFLTINRMGGMSLGASKTFLNQRARISLNYNDVFYTQKTSAVIDFGDVFVNFSQRNDSRNVRMTFSYQFGNTKVKNSRRRSTGSESETSRIKVE